MINKKSSILITGGTGSFGHSFVAMTLKKFKPRRLIIFSRDEMKQWEMSKKYKREIENGQVLFFIGDVRDKERLDLAFRSVDVIIHAAALKHVPIAEYNPFEFIKTNILGANNVIEAALQNNVKSVVALSTDKAVSPINLYGATKLCSDKLFCAANNIKGNKNINFSVVRYGNVFGSRGSVYPVFTEQYKKNKCISLTDRRMTRFNIFLEDAVKMVDWAIHNSIGGEIFVPKLESFKVTDFIKAGFQNAKLNIIGIRPGEKLHEKMIDESDSENTFDIGKYYAIVNSYLIHETYKKYEKNKKYKKVKAGFSLDSGKVKEYLTIKKLKTFFKNS